MNDDLLHDLRELPPASLDISPDFYERVMTTARRRQRVKRAGITGIAAAVVGAVVAVSVSLSSISSTARLDPVAPASPSATTATPAPSPTTSPTTSPASTPSASDVTPTPSNTAPPTETSTVTLGGAVLTLPAGWVAEAVATSPPSIPIVPTWCLMPHSAPAPTSADAVSCTIAFSAVSSGQATPELSVDTPGGLFGNPEYCDPKQPQTVSLLSYQDSTFGGRPADYRNWLYVCADGRRWPIEQYVADDAPGYVLVSFQATSAVHTVLSTIAETAQLPAISAPLRLSDFGIVRTLAATTEGYDLTLDRVVRGTTGLINNNPQTYNYSVPTAAVLSSHALHVGDLVELNSNGTSVFHLQVDPT